MTLWRARRTALSGRAMLLVAALAIPPAASAFVDEERERAQLAAMLRQLDQIERQACAPPTRDEARAPSRYHFDYARLIEDVRRIRAGIDAYLTPARGQPRNLQDASPIIGGYTRQFDRGGRP
jgi:RAQPRD family integrative conjugative element protein